MKLVTKSAIALVMAAAAPAFATIQFSSDFSTFANGNLVGQGGWSQVGSSATLPLQVNAGVLQIPALAPGNGDNQDAAHSFGPVANTGGTSLYVGANLTVTASAAANSSTSGTSFFLALQTTDATPFNNFRVVTRQGVAPNTFQFGIRPTGQTGNTFAFGGDLDLGTNYNVILAWNFVSGAQNDTIAAYINPTGTDVSTNTAYITNTQNNATGDAPGFGGLVISQFTGATSPAQAGVNIGRIIATDSFGEATSYVPTPGSAGLVLLAGLVAGRRRRA